jgi:hypothetical protein
MVEKSDDNTQEYCLVAQVQNLVRLLQREQKNREELAARVEQLEEENLAMKKVVFAQAGQQSQQQKPAWTQIYFWNFTHKQRFEKTWEVLH